MTLGRRTRLLALVLLTGTLVMALALSWRVYRQELVLVWYGLRFQTARAESSRLGAAKQLALWSADPQPLERALGNCSSPSACAAAVTALAEYDPPRGVDELVRTLPQSRGDRQGVAIVEYLGASEWTRALPALLDVLGRESEGSAGSDFDPRWRDATFAAILRIGKRDGDGLWDALSDFHRTAGACRIPPRTLAALFEGLGPTIVPRLLHSDWAWLIGGMSSAAIRGEVVKWTNDVELRDAAFHALDELRLPLDIGLSAPEPRSAPDELSALGSALRPLGTCRADHGLFGRFSSGHAHMVGGGTMVTSPQFEVTTWQGEKGAHEMQPFLAGDLVAVEFQAFGRLVQFVSDGTPGFGSPELWRVTLPPKGPTPSLDELRRRLAERPEARGGVVLGEPQNGTVVAMLKDAPGDHGDWTRLVVGLTSGDVLHVDGTRALRATIESNDGGHPLEERSLRDLAWGFQPCKGLVSAEPFPAIPVRVRLPKPEAHEPRTVVVGAGTPPISAGLRQCMSDRLHAWQPEKWVPRGEMLALTVRFGPR